ncbi:hypothetical protein BKA82DRAFT_4010078 [Pisolithus tinctorius]|nr:hypothetical protein BKA82DRAFT_4010078 [Pisolithus tinctorius]
MVDIARCRSTFHLNHGFLRFPHQWLIHFHPPPPPPEDDILPPPPPPEDDIPPPPPPPEDDIPPPPPPPNDLEVVAEEVPPPQPSKASDDSKEQTPPPQSDEDETDNALIPPPPPSLQGSDSHHSVTSPDGNDTPMDTDITLELPAQPPSDEIYTPMFRLDGTGHNLSDEEKREMEYIGPFISLGSPIVPSGIISLSIQMTSLIQQSWMQWHGQQQISPMWYYDGWTFGRKQRDPSIKSLIWTPSMTHSLR